jgi:hypothetical protein
MEGKTTMSTIRVEIPEEQVVSLVEQLSASAKHEVLKRLITDYDQWNGIVDTAEERMRLLCAERGLDWDRLDENQRLQLIDTLLHEA